MKNISVYIPNAISTRLGRQILIARKNSPTILFAAGIVGVVTTTVLASRATLKLEDLMEDAQKDLNSCKQLALSDRADYTEADCQRDSAYLYARTVVSIGKLYAPAFLVGAASIACLTGSHKILSNRNASLMAAYAALDTTFQNYRRRVNEEYTLRYDAEAAKLADNHFMYGSELHKTVDETGKEVTTRRVGGSIDPSQYARFFNNTNRNWEPTPEYNQIFLRMQQNYFNNLLLSRGHVFLNEVYDALGFERSQPGSVVGWLVGEGDSYIDFGLFDHKNPMAQEFINGLNDSILLDFNVDGVIYNKI